MKYEFTAKPYQYASSKEMCGWTLVSLLKEMSIEMRAHFKWLEEGWGRMKVAASIGSSEWKTAI